MKSTKKLHTQDSFAWRLRYVRQNLRLSLEEFGAKVGFDKSYLSRLERGITTNPSNKFLDAVCSQTTVSRDWLEKGEGKIITPEDVALATAKVDWAKLWPDAPPVVRDMFIFEDELGLLPFLKILMGKMSPDERAERAVALIQTSDIEMPMKTYWLSVIMRAFDLDAFSKSSEKGKS